MQLAARLGRAGRPAFRHDTRSVRSGASSRKAGGYSRQWEAADARRRTWVYRLPVKETRAMAFRSRCTPFGTEHFVRLGDRRTLERSRRAVHRQPDIMRLIPFLANPGRTLLGTDHDDGWLSMAMSGHGSQVGRPTQTCRHSGDEIAHQREMSPRRPGGFASGA